MVSSTNTDLVLIEQKSTFLTKTASLDGKNCGLVARAFLPMTGDTRQRLNLPRREPRPRAGPPGALPLRLRPFALVGRPSASAAGLRLPRAALIASAGLRSFVAPPVASAASPPARFPPSSLPLHGG